MLEMPLLGADIAQEYVQRLIIADEAPVEDLGVPVVQDVADVEDNGNRPHQDQPWRALKRRFVLLMT